MTRTLPGKRIIITGASGGIGQALAEQLARQGAKLVLASRNADKLQYVAKGLQTNPDNVLVVPTDITQDHERKDLLARTVERFGGLDVLINNAGLASWAHFVDSDEKILRDIMEVNFFAPAELIRSAIPLLVDGEQPAVVNIASRCGRRGLPAWSEYSTAKFALCGLTEALRGELARFDIDILLMVPGLTASGLADHLIKRQGKADIDFSGGMPPADVAAAIIHALVKNKTETVIGSDARWMLRCNRWFPRLVDYLLARRVKKLYAHG
jgi:short-subunit dehydrogenase